MLLDGYDSALAERESENRESARTSILYGLARELRDLAIKAKSHGFSMKELVMLDLERLEESED
jgi:hypothetical protein